MNILRVKILIGMLLTLIFTVASGPGCRAEDGAPSTPVSEQSPPQGGAYQASTIAFEKGVDGLAMTIKGNVPPTFTTYQLFDPLRVVIDIANATLAESLKLPIEVNQAPVAKISGSMLAEKEPVIAKLEILLNADSQYAVKRNGNDVTITFATQMQDSEQAVLPPVPTPSLPAVKADGTENRPEIYDLKISKEANGVKVLLVGDGPIQNFAKVALPKGEGRPDRMYVDIPGVKAPALEREMVVDAGGVSRIRIADRPEGARFVFDSSLSGLFAYEVAPAPEGLMVIIGANAPPSPSAGLETVDPVGQMLASATGQVPGGDAEARQANTGKEGNSVNRLVGSDEFAEAGYDRQKISVDFYKTNLHNVFRLMGEVGGNNIVVDESVNGVLTLSLREVPWDFLLDIILNLKGLQKVERYNTIVISAKEKGFVWPEKVSSKKELELESPGAELAVTIDKQLSEPPEIVEAKMLIQRGNVSVREGKFKEGLALYQKALDKWPRNAVLAKRMAGVCLVDLGYYQAAVDYAKKALAVDSQDPEAALQAAIGLANMKKPEARRYFEIAVSGNKPSRAALLSFAGFAEENSDFGGALATLAKYTEIHGAGLETMIARARIFDKQARPDLAVAEYQAILYSGYELAPDLARYIKGRLALANNNKQSKPTLE